MRTDGPQSEDQIHLRIGELCVDGAADAFGRPVSLDELSRRQLCLVLAAQQLDDLLAKGIEHVGVAMVGAIGDDSDRDMLDLALLACQRWRRDRA